MDDTPERSGSQMRGPNLCATLGAEKNLRSARVVSAALAHLGSIVNQLIEFPVRADQQQLFVSPASGLSN